MAKDNTGEEILDTSDPQEVENLGDTSDEGDTPAPDPVAERLKGFESQLERQRQENEALRESVRLQSRLLEQQAAPKQKSNLSPELQELRTAISPMFNEDIDSRLQPLVGTVGQLWDQNDAVAFQFAIQREHGASLDEDTFNKINQTVDAIRQRALRETGTWLKREDAYKYAKGDGQLKGIVTKRPTNKAELARQKQVAAAQSTVGNSEARREVGAPSAEIAKIRMKANAGVLLTPDEKRKWLDSMPDSPF